MTFVLLVGFKFKKYHFSKEISDLEQGSTSFQNTLQIAYFVIHFFILISHLHEEKHQQVYKLN